MITVGASGAAAELPFQLIETSTGNADDSHTWNDIGGGITDEFKVQLTGAIPGTYSNAVIAQMVNRGGGAYGYQQTSLETATAGKAFFYPNIVGYDGSPKTARWEDVVQVSVGALADGIISRTTFAQSGLDLFRDVRRNTAQAGSGTTIQLDGGASAVNDFYKDSLVRIVGGTGVGQTRRITGYVGATKTATVNTAWSVNPDVTSIFEIFGDSNISATIGAGSISRASFTQDALDLFKDTRRNTAQSGGASTIQLDAGASAIDDFYKFFDLIIVSGTGIGQARQITGYVGSTKQATVDRPWATNPDLTSIFEIFYNGTGQTAAAVAAAVMGSDVEGGNTLADMIRLMVSLTGCKVTDFTTGTLVFKSIDGSKTRWTVTTGPTGRLTVIPGDLT